MLISGEAGIGKSRLCAWLADEVAETQHGRLRYQCSPYHRDSALYPFAQQFERAAGIAPQEPPEVKLDKLERALGPATDRMNEVAPLIASMLSIPFGTRYPAMSRSPDQQRRLTLSALRDQMKGLAKKQPLLILFEDAQWADATSLEVLDLLLKSVPRLPALLLITFRPEFEAPWSVSPDVAMVTLGRLDRVEAKTLVARVTGGRELPAEVLAQIIVKTDGVPLFVEELTKHVLESGLLVEGPDRYRLDGPLPPLAIPSTLQDSLMARLDRLAAVKDIAQIGAAIGREFSYPCCTPLSAATSRRCGPRSRNWRIRSSSSAPASRLPRATRSSTLWSGTSPTKACSRAGGRSCIRRSPRRYASISTPSSRPSPNCSPITSRRRASPGPRSNIGAGRAGDLALYRSAFKEAIAHLGKAIEMTEALAGAGEVDQTGRKLKLHVAYAHAMIAAHGHGAPETVAAFVRAHELAADSADMQARFSSN